MSTEVYQVNTQSWDLLLPRYALNKMIVNGGGVGSALAEQSKALLG